ncbi:hypothetical protein, partial [Blautia stercoris]|nr:hypothetical protein [Blautia stercoris]
NSITDFSFLASPEVSGFHELNPLSISVKGIAAASTASAGGGQLIFRFERRLIKCPAATQIPLP